MFNVLNVSTLNVPRQRKYWPDGAILKGKFGQTVLWLSYKDGGHNVPEEELEKYRQIGDPQVDLILKLLHEEGTPLGPGDDFVETAKEAFEEVIGQQQQQQQQQQQSSASPARRELSSFYETYRTIPAWVDVKQLERGQEVYLKYAPAVSLSLYYRSLVAGFSIPKIAAVIRSTRYLAPPSRPDQVLQRLLDTGQLITSCIAHGVDELLPGGIGWKTALHVRALHAKVRRSLLQRKGSRTWDTSYYGVPINMEDMSATLFAFGINSLIGTEFVTGVPVPRQEMLDYLALWRYIGWLLGVQVNDGTIDENHDNKLIPLDPCGPGRGPDPDPVRHAIAIAQSIIFHILNPDETSVEIAHHLLKIRPARPDEKGQQQGVSKEKTQNSSSELNNWFYFRALQCRRFIGDPLADALELPFHPRASRRIFLFTASTVYLSILRLYTLAVMYIPYLGRKATAFHKRGMQNVHLEWQKTHKSRMAKALKTGKIEGVVIENKKNPQEGVVVKEENPKDVQYSDSCCPFAMIAPPTHHDAGSPSVIKSVDQVSECPYFSGEKKTL